MADFTTFVNELHKKTGLDIGVINAWVAREQGGYPGNVLGITSAAAKTASNPYGLVSYANQVAGADATANLLKSSSYYRGIIASTSGTPQEQALAIAQSPWHLGAMGLAKAGGTDPYYYAGFVQAGILPANAGSKPSQPGPTLQGAQAGMTAGALPGIDPTTVVTAKNVSDLAAKFNAAEIAAGIPNPRGVAGWVTFLRDFIGHPIGDAYQYVNLTNPNATSLGAAGAGGTTPLTSDAVAGIFGKFATDVVVNVILVGIGIAMIGLGLWTLVKGSDSLTSAAKIIAAGGASVLAREGTPMRYGAGAIDPNTPEPTPTAATVPVASTVGAGRGQTYSPETPRPPSRKTRQIRGAITARRAEWKPT